MSLSVSRHLPLGRLHKRTTYDFTSIWSSFSAFTSCDLSDVLLHPLRPLRNCFEPDIVSGYGRAKSRADHCAAFPTIVDVLLAHETLEGEDVEEIVSHWL